MINKFQKLNLEVEKYYKLRYYQKIGITPQL